MVCCKMAIKSISKPTLTHHKYDIVFIEQSSIKKICENKTIFKEDNLQITVSRDTHHIVAESDELL